MDRLTGNGSAMKSTLQTILAVIGIIALRAASKELAALKMAEQTLARNRNGLLRSPFPFQFFRKQISPVF